MAIHRLNPHLPVLTGPVFRIKVRSRSDAQVCQNVFYIAPTLPTGPIPTAAQIFATWWQTNVGPAWCPAVNIGVRFTDVIIDRLDDPTILAQTFTPTAGNMDGTQLGDALPPFNCYTIRRNTNTAGQRGRGSIRLVGVSESSQASGVVNAAEMLLLQGFAATVGTTMAVGPGPMMPVLARRVNTGLPVVVEGAPVVAWIVNLNIGSQDTRKYGRGR